MDSVEEHLARCLAGVELLAPREVPLPQAHGCLLAEDVVATHALPPFANSAMDGYAVVVNDLVHAAADAPVELPVAGDVPAGPGEPLRLQPGSVIRVMTGAPVPLGTQGVVPVEWTDGGTSTVRITQAPSPGQFLREAGEDVQPGAVVLRAGVRLTGRQLGLLAAVGRDRVLVHPRPRVVLLPTGSELVPPGTALLPGQIHDSNGYALAAAATEAGGLGRHDGFVGDDEDDVRAALLEATREADLLVTTGGVSAGAYDPVKAVLAEQFWFGKVAMQPGMPQGFGRLEDPTGRPVPVLTLPGNPVSCLVSFELFGAPLVRVMSGRPAAGRPTVEAVAERGWASPKGKRQFVRVVLTPPAGPGERAGVRPVGAQGSHLIADLAEANALAIVPEDVEQVHAADVLSCIVLDTDPVLG